DLLCHTSGIDDLILIDFIKEAADRSGGLPAPEPGRHPLVDRVMRLAAGAPLAYRPGTKMIYSNFGFLLMGDIVRRVSGTPFWQFARSRLFEPLGMHDTTFVLPPTLRERRIYRALGMPGTVARTPWTWGIDSEDLDEVDSGSQGCMSTAADFAVFAQML